MKKELANNWYNLVRPLGEYLSKKDKAKYQKIKDSITEEQAIKWFAESIVTYIIRYPKDSFDLIIADRIHSDDHWGYYCLTHSSFARLLKKRKHKIAFYKFNKTIEFQEKVVEMVRSQKGLVVKESNEYGHRRPENYQKTYFIKIEK